MTEGKSLTQIYHIRPPEGENTDWEKRGTWIDKITGNDKGYQETAQTKIHGK